MNILKEIKSLNNFPKIYRLLPELIVKWFFFVNSALNFIIYPSIDKCRLFRNENSAMNFQKIWQDFSWNRNIAQRKMTEEFWLKNVDLFETLDI